MRAGARPFAAQAARARIYAAALRSSPIRWRSPGSRSSLVLVLVAALAPVLAPYDPDRRRIWRAALPPPGALHWLGTDELGRDMLLAAGLRRAHHARIVVAAIAIMVRAGRARRSAASPAIVGGWSTRC